MTNQNTSEDRWMLSTTDLKAMEALRDELWMWRAYCEEPYVLEEPHDLLTIRAVTRALDSIICDGNMPNIEAQLSLSGVTATTLGSSDLMGAEVDFEIDDLGIVLVQTTYIDLRRQTLAQLTKRGGFDIRAIKDWLRKCASIRRRSPLLRCEVVNLPEL